MFEFGRDLRKIFAQARDSDDLSWLELVGTDLLFQEARQQTTDAGRVSCARPYAAWSKACALWREHARRAGATDSLTKAADAATDAAKHARNADEGARATIEAARILMLRFDLCGGPEHLVAALALLPASAQPSQVGTATAMAALSARLRARQVWLDGDLTALGTVLGMMDIVIRAARGKASADIEDLLLERAGLALELGVALRDPTRLDEAGQTLQGLVEAASPDYRPLSRARALTLCASGMGALAAMANDPNATDQARVLFDAAADQFTPDHSPMDWVAIQLVRSQGPTPPSQGVLNQAEDLTRGRGLTLGALAREAKYAREIDVLASLGDLSGLDQIEARLLDGLRRMGPGVTALDWATDQIALGRIALARTRLTGTRDGDLRMALIEAAATAREQGVRSLAERADQLNDRLTVAA
ncbi:hypothetical protein [Brevundimonas variabilis]|uniref:Uncharacterized protein n=1 Tax=Brevundimonas variabilis TaxID=74312 RepID=A0A7W9CFP4_9CAUL|nr:hypothetical protein [Brevundimonas variabilis]MBB5744586.1 hypothetical protein [Brevundimonas variabilis]